jgi:hypothetical protein
MTGRRCDVSVRLLGVLAALTIAGGVTPAHAGGYTPPGSIPAACQADATTALNAWIGTVPDGSVIDFPPGGCYRLDGSILLRDRNGLTFTGNGSTFKATNLVADVNTTRARFRIQYGGDLTFEGMTLAGAGNGVYDPAHEHDHGIFAQGVDGLTVTGVTGRGLVGDFVELAQGPDQVTPSRNVTLSRVDVSGIGRMGVSCVACDGFTVDRSRFDKVALHTFDVEIQGDNWPGRNIRFTNNIIGSHGWAAFSFGTPYQTTGNDISNIVIAGNTLTDPGSTTECRPAVSMASSKTRVSNMTVSGNRFPSHNAAVWLNDVSGALVLHNTFTHTAPYCGQGTAVYEEASRGVIVAGNTRLRQSGSVQQRAAEW